MADGSVHIARRGIRPADVKAAYGIGRSRVYELLREGKLRAKVDGGATIITVESLDAWFDALPDRPSAVQPSDVGRRRRG